MNHPYFTAAVAEQHISDLTRAADRRRRAAWARKGDSAGRRDGPRRGGRGHPQRVRRPQR